MLTATPPAIPRARSAIERKDPAALDSGLGFDELLERTGLHELFAARLELT